MAVAHRVICWLGRDVVNSVSVGSNDSSSGTGFGFEGLTPWDYLKTEAGVIVYYLRLVSGPTRW